MCIFSTNENIVKIVIKYVFTEITESAWRSFRNVVGKRTQSGGKHLAGDGLTKDFCPAYCKNPKNSDTRKISCNHTKI